MAFKRHRIFVRALFFQNWIHSAYLLCVTDTILRRRALRITNCFLRVTMFCCCTGAVGVWWCREHCSIKELFCKELIGVQACASSQIQLFVFF
jgi:hypothetical protein